VNTWFVNGRKGKEISGGEKVKKRSWREEKEGEYGATYDDRKKREQLKNP